MHRNLLYEYSELVAAKLNSCFSQGSLFPDASGRHQAWLIVAVYRWLRPLLTAVCDSTWNGYTGDHNEGKEMHSKWGDCERASRAQRECMSNWGICLLHPKDSNLADAGTIPFSSTSREGRDAERPSAGHCRTLQLGPSGLRAASRI